MMEVIEKMLWMWIIIFLPSLISSQHQPAHFITEVMRLGVGLLVDDAEQYFFEARLPPNSWVHLCVSYDHNNSKTLCAMDGIEEQLSARTMLSWGANWQERERKTEIKNSGEAKLDINEKLKCLSGASTKCQFSALIRNSTYVELKNDERLVTWEVCIGSEESSGPIEADVAAGVIWKRAMILGDLQEASGCLLYPSDQPPDLLLTPFKNASHRSYKLEEICGELQEVLVRPAGTHTQHKYLCGALGGSVPLADSLTPRIIQVATGVEDCVGPGGLITWIKGEGRRIEGEEETGGVINGECPGVSVNGSIWVSCEVRSSCGVCMVPSRATYVLYGHDGRLFDHTFYLVVSGTGEPSFKGMGGSAIIKDEGWILKSEHHQNQWILRDLGLPVGRKFWSTGLGNDTVLLTLTTCRTTQFSCDDGQCVSQTDRCDDIANCRDRSDEKNCLIVEKSRGYDPNNIPPPRPDEQTPILLPYHIDVYNVGDVTTEGGNASMDVGITITWYDPRLKFLNLKPAIKNYFPCELIWTPRVRAVFGHGTGNVLHTNDYEKFCCVYDNQEAAQRPLSDPYMGHHAEGQTHYVEVYLGVLAWVPCHFELYTYPFDYQLCNISFMVVNAPWTRVFTKSSPGNNVPYLNARRDLLEYVLEDSTTEVGSFLQGSDNNTYFVLTYHLKRLYGYHITNSFFPSLLMLVISYATFYFQLEDFTNRIMISLTAQLVLAALFTSTTQSSVKTPYLKLIDVWYAAIITFCFVILISQTIVNLLLHKPAKFNWMVWKVRSLTRDKGSKVEPLFIKKFISIPGEGLKSISRESTESIKVSTVESRTTISHIDNSQINSLPCIPATIFISSPEVPSKSKNGDMNYDKTPKVLNNSISSSGKSSENHTSARYFNSICRMVVMSCAMAFVFFYSLLAAGVLQGPDTSHNNN